MNFKKAKGILMKQTLLCILTFTLFTGFTASYTQTKKESPDTARAKAPFRVEELDHFHKLLHPLIHDAYPNKDFTAIRKALPELVKSAEKMAKSTLPEGLEKDQYRKKAGLLVKQLKAMNKQKGKMSDEKLGTDFMKMHDTFEGIMELVY